MTKIKALIKKAEYDENRDLVTWSLEDVLTGRPLTLAWRGRDLNEIFGVTMQIPPDLIRQFCEGMQGQVRDFEIKADITDPKQISKPQHELLDKYPFYEVEDKLKNEGR